MRTVKGTSKYHRICTYKVIFRRFRVNTPAPEKSVIDKHFEFVSVFMLSYQAHKSLLFCAVSYGHLWSFWL